MAVSPISSSSILVGREAIDENAFSMIGIDRGCSLTKAVYISKADSDSTASHYALQCVFYRNDDFEGCLHFLKENALLPSSGNVNVTGTGCDKYRDSIQRILGLEVSFINEFLTMFRGVHFLLNHAQNPDTLFYPFSSVEPDMEVVNPPPIQAQLEHVKKEMTRNNGPEAAMFPCIFILTGSASVVHCIQADGRDKMTGVSMVGGKSLLGLAKAMVGTSDYDELMELADQGDISNVDTTAGEFILQDPKSPYGHFPDKLPLFSFGKFADNDSKLEDCTRADRAIAVVRLVAQNIANLAVAAVFREGINRVVMGGNCIRGEPMRKAIFQTANTFFTDAIQIRFLKTGNTGALGAIISKNEDIAKYMMA